MFPSSVTPQSLPFMATIFLLLLSGGVGEGPGFTVLSDEFTMFCCMNGFFAIGGAVSALAFGWSFLGSGFNNTRAD